MGNLIPARALFRYIPCFIQRHKTRLTVHLILLRRTSYTKSTGTVGFEPTKTGRLTICSHTTCGRANIKRGRKSCGVIARLLLLGLTSSAFPPCSLTSTGVSFNSLSFIFSKYIITKFFIICKNILKCRVGVEPTLLILQTSRLPQTFDTF